jgi:hypothetical protein
MSPRERAAHRATVGLAACLAIAGLAGTVAPLTSLRRGQIVAVRYRSGAEPYAAESIATPPTPDAGRPR